MTSAPQKGEVWPRARRTYEGLLDLEADDRVARLEKIREDDPEVHSVVCELLDTPPVEDGFLEPPSQVRELDWSFGPAGARLGPEAPSEAAPADLLDDFRLVRRIGEGGMGQVWEAEQVSLGGRRVALKLIRPDQVNEQTIQLFQREARAGGRLSHPGIVSVHGYGETDGTHWIAMELVPGNWTLRDFLKEIREAESVPADYYRRIAELVAEISESLQVAHDAGVIHRDLKPQNILITQEDRPKLTDFGLARVSDDSYLSRTGDFAGTYAYMSPEQITAKRMGLDHRTDVFSLGVVLYELLTFQRPFDGDTTHQIATKIITHDPPDPSQVRSQCPRDLSAIVGKALEKQPDRRYSTAEELAADLRRFLGGDEVFARLPSAIRIGWRWVRRHRIKSSFAALTVVALVVVSGLLANLRLLQEQQFVYTARGIFDELNDEVPLLLRAGYEADPSFQSWRERAEWLRGQRPRLVARLEMFESEGRAVTQEVGAETRALRNLLQLMDTFFDSSSTAIAKGRGVFPELVRVRAASLDSPEARARWEELEADRGGIEPVCGLLPLARNADSGLWELIDLYSGPVPELDDDGDFAGLDEGGIVFVSVPAGDFLMGAQAEDEEAPNYSRYIGGNESPVHPVSVDAFLIARTELTRGQYFRVTGTHTQNADQYLPDLVPASSLSWQDARTFCV